METVFNKNAMERDLTYDVKCRKCGEIFSMWFGNTKTTLIEDFHKWANEHSTFPIEKQCRCDNGSMMFHDLVSYKPF